MRVLEEYGAVISRSSRELKLQKIRNDQKEEKLALVTYKDGMSVRIMDIQEEYKELRRLLEEYLGYKVEKKKADVIPFNDVVHSLTSLPAGDTNYDNPLKKTTEEELRQAIEIMESDKDGKNKTRIKVCQGELDRRGRSVKTAVIMTPPTKDKATETDDEKEMIMPSKYTPLDESKKPTIIPLKTEGNRTYGECIVRIGREKKMFTDTDSQYVLDGLAELCKVDPDFRNNFMRDDKTYGGFMEYMYRAAQNGYCNKFGNTGWLDRDRGLALAIDYYNADKEKMDEEEKKKREAELKKRKAETAKKKKEVAKNGRKKTK